MSIRDGSQADPDEALKVSLRREKFASSGYLDNPNATTASEFISASKDHARLLLVAGLDKQAGEMRKVYKDFGAAEPSKKRRIVVCIAKSLVGVTVRTLTRWTIGGIVTAAGVGYALYEIGENGRLVDVSDVNLDGVIDSARIDVDYDGIADYQVQDLDGDGRVDQIGQAIEGTNGGGFETIASGGWVETFSDILEGIGELFS